MPGYHSAGDTADRVQPDTLTAMARLVIGTVEQLAIQRTNPAPRHLEQTP